VLIPNKGIPVPGPLKGIRVIDLSRVLAGPWATQCLADMGADVIKVERVESGDDTRSFPPFAKNEDGGTGESIYFLSTNRGKRSITVDLAQPEGQELVRRLADNSDIVIENYKVGNLAKFGLDYATLSARNPRLIYCSITGFGQTGPHRARAGYDIVIQAMGGLMSITGEDGRQPVKSGVAIVDILTGLYASQAILAALYERGSSGKGQHIDLALLDVQIATLANQGAEYLMTGEIPKRHGNAHGGIVPYQDFETSDGRIIVAVANDSQFARLAQILGMPLLAGDPKYRANVDRVRNRETLLPMLGERFKQRCSAEWVADLDREGIPTGPINSLKAVFEEPQIAARDLVVEFVSTDGMSTRLVGSPIRFSRTAVEHILPPPKLGEHTDQILADVLHESFETIVDLHKKQII
jgi:crotonobetainyl-CoA:carnitine CoA-transferase CaiB-like acyl-CoA transferase